MMRTLRRNKQAMKYSIKGERQPIYVLDENGNPLSGESYEIYGDTIDRTVIFPDGTDFSKFAGTPVRLRFRMMNTKLFSMKFE